MLRGEGRSGLSLTPAGKLWSVEKR